MMSALILKQQLYRDIEELPEDKLEEVLDFVGFLLSRQSRRPHLPEEHFTSQSADPIEEYIGGDEHGALAQGVDEDLYGP